MIGSDPPLNDPTYKDPMTDLMQHTTTTHAWEGEYRQFMQFASETHPPITLEDILSDPIISQKASGIPGLYPLIDENIPSAPLTGNTDLLQARPSVSFDWVEDDIVVPGYAHIPSSYGLELNTVDPSHISAPTNNSLLPYSEAQVRTSGGASARRRLFDV